MLFAFDLNPFFKVLFEFHGEEEIKKTHFFHFLQCIDLLIDSCVMVEYVKLETVDVEHD